MKRQILLLLFLCNGAFSTRTCWKRPKNPGQKLSSYFRPFARVGRTINLNNDQLGPLVFSEEFIKNNIIEKKTSSTETKFKVIKTDEEAKRMLDISGKLSLQLQLGTAGSVAAQGAGSYLQNMGDRATYAELLLIVGSTKRFTILNNEEKNLTRETCKTLMKNGDTHLITGFEYGGQCIISVRVKVDSKERKTKMEGEMEGKVDVGKVKGEIKGSLTRTLMEINKLENVTIKTYCNANFETVPTNITEAMEVSRNALKLLKLQNQEGVPTRMELTPLTLYKKCRDVPRYRSATYNDIYLESCAAMMNDAGSGLKRLQECVDNYNLSPQATHVKKLVMSALSDMRKAEYDMSLSMRDVNGASGIDQFKDFEKLYDAGRGHEPWNYRHWTEYAIVICNSMISYSVPPEQTVNLTLTPVVELGFWTETNVDTTLNGLSPVMTNKISSLNIGCHNTKHGKSLLMLIKDDTKNMEIRRLEMIIYKDYITRISKAHIFKSDKKAAFDDENDPSFELLMTLGIDNTKMTYDLSGFFRISVNINAANQTGIRVVKLSPRSASPINICSMKAVANNHKWMAA